MPDDSDRSIDKIISAKDHYAVLNVPINIEASKLRRAYLTASVKVHPDKNSDPRATQAFQRVAEAWNVLSDEETRAHYDARSPDDNDNNSYNNNNGYYPNTDRANAPFTPPPPPSFQDALFAFAAATSMMGGGGSGGMEGSMAQTLFWSEKLVQGRGRGEQHATEQTANAAMALGSGLRAVAFGAKMMGFKNAAASADRGATMAQALGFGSMAANAAKDNPVMAKVLETGGERARNIHQSVKGHLEKPSVQEALKKGGDLRKNMAEQLEKGKVKYQQRAQHSATTID